MRHRTIRLIVVVVAWGLTLLLSAIAVSVAQMDAAGSRILYPGVQIIFTTEYCRPTVVPRTKIRSFTNTFGAIES